MNGAILILTPPEGDAILKVGGSAEPFFALATQAANTGKIGKDVLKEVQIIRVSGHDANCLKHVRCPTQAEIKAQAKAQAEIKAKAEAAKAEKK